MTYEEAQRSARAIASRVCGEWMVKAVAELEETGLTTDEAQRQFFAAIDRHEVNQVIARRTAELMRVLLDPRAPERLQ